MTSLKRIIVLLSVAAVISIGVIGCVVEAQRWNNPRLADQTQGTDLEYHGLRFHLSVVCKCPAYLFLGEAQQIVYSFTLSPAVQLAHGPAILPSPTRLSVPVAVPDSTAAAGQNAPDEKLWVWPSIDGSDVAFIDNHYFKYLLNTRALVGNGSGTNTGMLQIVGKNTPVKVDFHLGSVDASNNIGPDIGSLSIVLPARPRFSKAFLPYFSYAAVFIFLSSMALVVDWRIRTANKRREEKVARAKELADKNPEHTRFAWQLARTRLENYFDRNLFQVNLVFWLAVCAMTAGFLVVLWGVRNTLEGGKGGEIAAGAGVITQFLGATFMVIYRSTMQQANDFMTVLDRINNVGMAMQVLIRYSDEPARLNEVRAKIVDRLLTLGRTQDRGVSSKKPPAKIPNRNAPVATLSHPFVEDAHGWGTQIEARVRS